MSTLTAPAGRPLQEVLSEDPRIVAAAFVAETFSIDIIDVLSAPRDVWRIRLAGAQARARANNPDATETAAGSPHA